jgi:hypothetical protein
MQNVGGIDVASCPLRVHHRDGAKLTRRSYLNLHHVTLIAAASYPQEKPPRLIIARSCRILWKTLAQYNVRRRAERGRFLGQPGLIALGGLSLLGFGSLLRAVQAQAADGRDGDRLTATDRIVLVFRVERGVLGRRILHAAVSGQALPIAIRRVRVRAARSPSGIRFLCHPSHP